MSMGESKYCCSKDATGSRRTCNFIGAFNSRCFFPLLLLLLLLLLLGFFFNRQHLKHNIQFRVGDFHADQVSRANLNTVTYREVRGCPMVLPILRPWPEREREREMDWSEEITGGGVGGIQTRHFNYCTIPSYPAIRLTHIYTCRLLSWHSTNHAKAPPRARAL